MKRSDTIQGMTAIIVVLFTLLLLAGMLAASMRLGLASRQNAGDQAAVLQAQYQVESAIALTRSRLRDIQALLSSNYVNPAGIDGPTLQSYAESFCGSTTWTDATDRTGALECQVTATANANQFTILDKVIAKTAYSAVLPSAEASSSGTASWWKQQLTQAVTVGSGTSVAKYTIQPSRVQRIKQSSFRFFFRVANITAKGLNSNNASGTRVLAGSADQSGEWWVDVTMPAFLDNVLFTNFHHSKAGGDIVFDAQQFNGPVHTNEKFLFYSGATAKFTRKITSSGCTNLLTIAANATTCTATPGVYLGSSSNMAGAGTATTQDAINAAIKQKIDNYTDVTWENMDPGYPNFMAQYRPMPTTANTQAADAQAGGLYFSSSVKSVELRAGDNSGNPPTSYNSTTKKWSPTPAYQYITVTNSSNIKTFYRYDSGKTLYQASSISGPWSFVKNNFNGVIFGADTIGYTDTSGYKRGGITSPGRNASGQAYPALAPFAQVTVSAQNNINISNDLTMSETPLICAENDVTCKQDQLSRKNVLGIYVQSGNVVITKNAPNDVNIHAMTMSAKGEVTVDDYTNATVGRRGNVNLIGGLVENYYGAFGVVGTSGYGRNFSYDNRFLDIPGFGPPSFPVSPKWEPTDAKSLDSIRAKAGLAPLRLDSITWKQASSGDYQ